MSYFRGVDPDQADFAAITKVQGVAINDVFYMAGFIVMGGGAGRGRPGCAAECGQRSKITQAYARRRPDTLHYTSHPWALVAPPSLALCDIRPPGMVEVQILQEQKICRSNPWT
jgi:hypothetical protein